MDFLLFLLEYLISADMDWKVSFVFKDAFGFLVDENSLRGLSDFFHVSLKLQI